MRERKGVKPTANALQIALTKLGRWRENGHDPTEVLESAVLNNWTGLWEPKAKTQTGNHHGKPSLYDRRAETLAAFGAGADPGERDITRESAVVG